MSYNVVSLFLAQVGIRIRRKVAGWIAIGKYFMLLMTVMRGGSLHRQLFGITHCESSGEILCRMKKKSERRQIADEEVLLLLDNVSFGAICEPFSEVPGKINFGYPG